MARPETPAIVVCDAGPLIHLDELRSIDLLTDFSQVYVPNAVWEEVTVHRPAALAQRRVVLTRVEVIPEPTASLIRLLDVWGLDPGESEALQLMERFAGATLLSDDQAAREAAAQLGYPFLGTIGVVLQSVDRRLRTKQQALNLLRSIPLRSTLHIRPSVLNTIIARLEASPP